MVKLAEPAKKENRVRADYDVVIAGFGPTGAMAANMLGHHNIPTLVVDPTPEIYDIPRGVHFDGETMRIFQSIGIADTVMAQSVSNNSLNFVNGRGASLMRFELGRLPRTAGWPADIFFRQPLVERHLRDNLARFDTLSFELGWAVAALEQTQTHVAISLRHAETGETKSVSARYLIGADGADSTVRQLAGIALEDLECDEPWLVVDWELDRDIAFSRDVYQFCDPKRPGTLVPCAGQHIRWEFMINPGDDYAAMEDSNAVRAMMQPYLRHLGANIGPEDGQILRSKVYQFHALLAARMRANRVFLMGDAAHQMPPFLGQGMCAGLRDAENLAWKLAGVLQGRYAPSLLDSYHSERYAHVCAVIKQAVQIGEIIQTRDPVKAFMRDTFLRLGKLTPKLLSGIQFGQTWRLGDGLLADDRAAGRQIPQPLVCKGEISDKLDAFLPEGFCLLMLDDAGRADLQRVLDSHQGLACQIISLSTEAGSNDADLTEREDFISDMAEQFNVCGYLLRPDRQIYAALKTSETPLVEQLAHHLQELSARLLADGQKREQKAAAQ